MHSGSRSADTPAYRARWLSCARRRTCPAARRPRGGRAARAGERVQRATPPRSMPSCARRRTCSATRRACTEAELREAANLSGAVVELRGRANMSSGVTPPRSMPSCARRRTCPAARHPRAVAELRGRANMSSGPTPAIDAELREAAHMSGGATPRAGAELREARRRTCPTARRPRGAGAWQSRGTL